MKSPLYQQGSRCDMPLLIAAISLLALAFSLPGRWHSLPGRVMSLLAAILLAISVPLLGGPLLIYLIFKPRHPSHS
jgi:hypothetical protein